MRTKQLMNAEVIICTEKGYLEATSKLMIFSLRNFGGSYSKLPIFSYNPRKGKPLSRSTLKFFEENEVVYIDLPLNLKYTDYPYANKPIACNHREQKTSADILIYLDSDTFFLNPPNEFAAISEADVLLRPVHIKNVGTDAGFSGVYGEYWKKLYGLLGVKNLREITTSMDRKKILEYFNGGMFLTKTQTGLFRAYHDNFEKVMAAGLMPGNEKTFVEQTVFAATVSQMELEVKLLSKYYNCPEGRFMKTASKSNAIDDMHNVVLVHHHNIFRNRDASNPFFEKLDYFPNGKIINQKLIEFSVLSKNVEGMELLKSKLKTALKQVRPKVLQK